MFAKRRTAIKALAALALASACSLALAAQVAGTVVNLSGPLMAKKGDGTVKVLALRSEVEQGDTLVAERNTYAQIKFIDNSEVTLKPNTTFKIDAFAYDEKKPDADNASFTLVKGGLRSITGLLGKRNKEKFALKTPTATIGIRGTTFTVQYVAEDEQALAASRLAYNLASTAALDRPAPGARGEAGAAAAIAPLMLAQGAPPPMAGLPPGLYVHVIDGLISVSNRGGTQSFSAGQFGFAPTFAIPPVQVPNIPASIRFSPPPSFSSTTSGGQGGAGRINGEVNCIVR
jgi:hypothetical protein